MKKLIKITPRNKLLVALVLLLACAFIGITVKQVIEAIDKLNSRPRKCLNFKTPYEIFEKLTGADVRIVMGYALIT